MGFYQWKLSNCTQDRTRQDSPPGWTQDTYRLSHEHSPHYAVLTQGGTPSLGGTPFLAGGVPHPGTPGVNRLKTLSSHPSDADGKYLQKKTFFSFHWLWRKVYFVESIFKVSFRGIKDVSHCRWLCILASCMTGSGWTYLLLFWQEVTGRKWASLWDSVCGLTTIGSF